MSSKLFMNNIFLNNICYLTHFFLKIILNLGSPLESPKVVHSHPHFPFVPIKR